MTTDHPNGPLYIKTIPIRAIKLSTIGDIRHAREKASNPKDAVIGNYLITGHRGCNYCVKQEIFEEMYEPYNA